MCGIWFSLGYNPDRRHLDVIAHRGPDGEGWREFETASGPLVMGHQRLAIIDTSDAGAQPMSFDDERYWITYNGEIYNYVELREELRALGHEFRTHSDTEVILCAYAVWGRGALSRLRGMFAFALYDRREGCVLLARDRFGIKPLYYAGGRGFAAASEIKQLLELDDVTRRINPRRAHDFLAGGLLDHSAETMFADVTQVAPGEWLELRVNRSVAPAARGRWYELPSAGSLRLGRDEAAFRFGLLLEDSIRLHLRADVEVGSCLSGGLDSSAIVALMSERLHAVGGREKLNAVTARFEGTAVDETMFADAVADAAHARSHAARPRADDIFEEATRIIWHQDEPYGSTSIHAQWHVFAVARANGLKVMLDGQGADEILAGYHGVYDLRYAELIRTWRLVGAMRLAARRHQWFGQPLLPQFASGVAQLAAVAPAAVRRPLSVLHRTMRNGRQPSALASRSWLRPSSFGVAPMPSVFDQALIDAGLPAATDVASLCVGLTRTGSLPMLLHWEDRNSMAHGVEARVPFLDHPLVEFAIGLGGEHKIVDGWTKWVLRQSMRDRLPTAVRLRKDKLGFATPEAAWLRGPLREPLREAIHATLRRFPEHFSASETNGLADEMLDGRRAMDFTLWRIACFGLWAERFGATF